jgi:hypothetical protein
MTIEEFIERTRQREIPVAPMARVRVFTRELAEGASHGLWDTTFDFRYYAKTEEAALGMWFDQHSTDERLDKYLTARWEGNYPNLQLLQTMGYIERRNDRMDMTRHAFKLLDEVMSANVFISYKRTESSAFALLINRELKGAGLEPFIDMALIPGDNWEESLKKRIQESNYLIVLLGKETLRSQVTVQELGWALDANVTLIPIWHNGFVYKSGTWDTIPVRIDKILTSTHTIRVVEENPVAYQSAIIELLNRFGVTP